MYEELYICDTSEIKLPSAVVLCGTSYCDGNYKIERPQSVFGTIEYVISGTGTIFLNGKKYTASAGDAYFLPPNTDQFYYSDDKCPWTKVFFNMTGSMMKHLSEEYSLENQVVFNNCDICAEIKEIIEIFKDNDNTPYNIQEKSFLVIQKIFLNIYKQGLNSQSYPKEVTIIKDYIDSHLTGNISLEEISKMVFLSKNFVIRLFKNHIGMTPYDYFLNKKMELSKQLLTTTSMPIKQISNYLGFDNPRYYSRCFFKKYGVSPSHYKKTQ